LTVCIDFDGVIHSYTSGWQGIAKIPDPPVSGAIDALFRLLDAGFEVAIYSSRSSSFRGRWAMKRWMECGFR
jgi:phosphoglycolate phosphatase-like HAD superfamily hydrolase